MLPKKTILISAMLTAFVLSVLGGVVMALKPPAVSAVAAASAAPASLSAEEAAASAARVLNQQEIYSVESTTFNGVAAYEVVFSSGQVATVGLDGQVLSVEQIQPVVVTSNSVAPAFTSPVLPASAAASHSSGEHEGGEHENDND